MAKARKNNDKEEPLETQLWKAADKLRKNIDAAEYKHVVLGLIFLRYISDAFEGLYDKLKSGEGEYALAEGKKGGQFYTPRSVVEVLVEMLEPYKGRVFDPCCGSGGMFVQSEKFVARHQGKVNDISIWGWPMKRMILISRSGLPS
ncbi:MAG: SAM-dependent DNA methyltransferase, partial [Desulfamplus sp.]|nr:SAM-dependent DNA methyltransferase [Desulfamplus sp.]